MSFPNNMSRGSTSTLKYFLKCEYLVLDKNIPNSNAIFVPCYILPLDAILRKIAVSTQALTEKMSRFGFVLISNYL
jgi:hypothetical protein